MKMVEEVCKPELHCSIENRNNRAGKNIDLNISKDSISCLKSPLCTWRFSGHLMAHQGVFNPPNGLP